MNGTKLPPDVGTICAVLEIDPGWLADIFRREAARMMRVAADLVDDDAAVGRSPLLKQVGHLLLLIDVLEDEWALENPEQAQLRVLRQEVEGDDGGELGGTEATPRTPQDPTPSSRDDIVSGDDERVT